MKLQSARKLFFFLLAGLLLTNLSGSGLVSTAFAEGTRTWEQSKFDELTKGTATGVAIRSTGGSRAGAYVQEPVRHAFHLHLGDRSRRCRQRLCGGGRARPGVPHHARGQGHDHFRTQRTPGAGAADWPRRRDLRRHRSRWQGLQARTQTGKQGAAKGDPVQGNCLRRKR